MATGYEPDISAIFSFKNNVDSFYLKYLQRDHILCELYIVKRTTESTKDTVKIAEANLPLSVLLSGEAGQTQAMSWMCTFGDWKGKMLGTIIYKMRMRHKIDKAVEIENRKQGVVNKRYDEQEQRMLKHGITPII